jgi:hypothetical protein
VAQTVDTHEDQRLAQAFAEIVETLAQSQGKLPVRAQGGRVGVASAGVRSKGPRSEGRRRQWRAPVVLAGPDRVER